MKRTSKSYRRKLNQGSAAKTPSKSVASIAGQAQPSSRRSFWLITTVGLLLILLVGGGLLVYRWSVSSQIAGLSRSADAAVRAADWPALERIARQWAMLEPNSVQPWTMAASAARAMGDLQQCAAYLAQLPDAAPVEAFHELSLLQMETLIQPLAARQTCERTLRIYPADNESSLRLLFIHAMLCHRQAITTEAQRAIRTGADSRATYAYLFAANWLTFANGDKLNRFWLEQDPENEDFQIAALSHAILHRDIHSVAAADISATDNSVSSLVDEQAQLDDLLIRYPKNIELRMIVLTNYLQAGQVTDLGSLLETLPAAATQDSRYWRFKGWYLAAQEQWPEASAAYHRALEICPFDFSSQNELAGVVRRNQGVEASQDLQIRAKLGIELSLVLLSAPNFEAVSSADYAQLADYFKLCGETEFSNGLRKHLR